MVSRVDAQDRKRGFALGEADSPTEERARRKSDHGRSQQAMIGEGFLWLQDDVDQLDLVPVSAILATKRARIDDGAHGISPAT
jgi:hypothetical protein